MRITGGKLGGRRLVAPDDARVRPTSDRTRQAIFNILAHRDFGIGFTLENIAVADLFAGTGALGIEALSRGARFCLFVDDDADSRALLRENVEALALTDSMAFVVQMIVRISLSNPRNGTNSAQAFSQSLMIAG